MLHTSARNNMGITVCCREVQRPNESVYPGSVRGPLVIHAAPHGTLDNRGKRSGQ